MQFYVKKITNLYINTDSDLIIKIAEKNYIIRSLNIFYVTHLGTSDAILMTMYMTS